MARYTVLQSGDFNAAENFGALAGDIDRNGIVSGLALSNYDSAAPSIDVAAGKTVHVVDSQTAEAELDDGTTISEQRDQVQLVCHVDSQTVSLTDGTVNELYLDPQPASDDSPQLVSVTSGSPPTDAVKIGEADTSNDTISEQWNLIAPDGTLTYPDADAMTAAASDLEDGTVVYDRANEQHQGVVAGTPKPLSPWTDSDSDGIYTLPDDASGASVGTLEADIATHATELNDDYTVPSGSGTVLSGPVTGSGSISGDGHITILKEGEYGVPSGLISMWSGDISNIPNGWTLCDGSDPRSDLDIVPDLRNRFVTGAGDEYAIGDTGGEKEHQLTEDELPSHVHEYEKRTGNESGGEATFVNASNNKDTTNTTSPTGGDQAHENRPRFYAVAYIYKL